MVYQPRWAGGSIRWPKILRGWLEEQIAKIHGYLEYLDNSYFIILGSNFASDPIFHSDNFDTLPIHFIEKTISTIIDTHKRDANVNSITTAQLAVAVYGFMGSKDITADQFLPYPTQAPDLLSIETERIFIQLMDEKRLPEKVIMMCGKYQSQLFKES